MGFSAAKAVLESDRVMGASCDGEVAVEVVVQAPSRHAKRKMAIFCMG
jgi:hypothetical protein